jgi:hypothetical protein
MKEYRFIGLRRSGNHAILNWIRKQLPDDHCFLDDPPIRQLSDQISAARKDHSSEVILYSVEDENLPYLISEVIFQERFQLFGEKVESIDIIILRDPFNLFASRLKSDIIETRSRYLNFVDLWIQYAREFLGETSHLKGNVVFINYNDWFLSKEYRVKIAKELGLSFNDSGVDEVPSRGGGSSFDGSRFNNKGSQMDVLARWKVMQNNSEFRQCFGDGEIIRLSKKLFNLPEATEVCEKFRGNPVFYFFRRLYAKWISLLISKFRKIRYH